MKFRKMIEAGIAAVMLCMNMVPLQAEDGHEAARQADDSLRILFTSDLHSHIEPYDALDKDGNTVEIGGYARLKTAIDASRTEDSVLVDAGDFTMGSLFNSVFTSDAPDLTLLGMMGYDAVTFGNHEFDYGARALGQMLEKCENAPALVSGNIQFDDSSAAQYLKKAMDEHQDGSSLIVEKDGHKIGIFGIMGEEAAGDITDAPGISWADSAKSARSIVEDLKKQGADFILCLSHSGDHEADKKLADEVSDIDVIISGHSHTTTEQPIVEKNTVIVGCGCYGQYLGVLDVNPQSNEVTQFRLIPVDDSFAADADISAKVDEYKQDVQNTYLNTYNYSFDTQIAQADFSLHPLSDLYGDFGDYNLGDLIADACRSKYTTWYDSWYEAWAADRDARLQAAREAAGETDEQANAAESPAADAESENEEAIPSVKEQVEEAYERGGQDSTPVPSTDPDPAISSIEAEKPAFLNNPIGITANGVIRSSICSGPVTVSDVFSLSSFGQGVDGTAGHPLVIAFLKGSDLRKVCELDATVGRDMMHDARLYFSGLKYTYDMKRLPLNRVEEVYVQSADNYYAPVQDDALYPVITNIYLGKMMNQVSSLSKGVIQIHLYDAYGNEEENLNDLVVYDDNGHEVKEWTAIADYLSSMSAGDDGLPHLSSQYSYDRRGKTEDKIFSFQRYFMNTSEFALKIYRIIAIAAVVIAAVLILIVHFARRMVHRRRQNKVS